MTFFSYRFFLIAVLSTICIGLQNYLFASSASVLSSRLRSLSFKAILRQDGEWYEFRNSWLKLMIYFLFSWIFWQREQQRKWSYSFFDLIPMRILIALQTGSLTGQLSDNPQKVNGLAGITLATIVQSIASLIAGSILGLAFIWRVGLVGIGTLTTKFRFLWAHNHGLACTPLLISSGFVRLVSFGFDHRLTCTDVYNMKRVIYLKDQKNKKAHAESAQLACEAAGSIRTVASLTREADCLALYRKSLETPLKNSGAILPNMLYAFSQAQVFGIIALVFWYGAVLVSRLQATTFQFFVGLLV